MKDKEASAIIEGIWAKTIGEQVLCYLKTRNAQELAEAVNEKAMRLLGEIKEILDDQALDDPECFQRVERMAEAFSEAGIPTARHDW